MVIFKSMPCPWPPFLISIFCVCILFESCTGIVCHKCSHINHEVSHRGIYDRIQASPSSCDTIDYCDGEWCVQELNGGNITFSCSSHAPLQESLFDSSIDSQCQAYFGANNILHAICYCKTGDYCNFSNVNFVNLLVLIPFILLTYLA